MFFGWWPRNEAHFLRYALRAARTLHPHRMPSVTGLFKPPTPADRIVFSTLVRLTRAQHSHPRRQHGSWLPVFDHESAHRCRADRVSRTPEVLPSMLERPLCCHRQRGRIRQLDQFLHPGSRLLSQKVIVHLPHELVSVRRWSLVCHASDCSCGKKARSETRWSRGSAKRRESSTQTLWSFGSNSASTFQWRTFSLSSSRRTYSVTLPVVSSTRHEIRLAAPSKTTFGDPTFCASGVRKPS